MAKWGTFKWGTTRWGGVARKKWQAGSYPNAKPDTRFFSNDTNGLEIDLSQESTDLTDGGGYYYESSSSRTDLPSNQGTLFAEFDIWSDTGVSGASGTILVHGDVSSSTERYRIQKSNKAKWAIQIDADGSEVIEVDLPGAKNTDSLNPSRVSVQVAIMRTPNDQTWLWEIWVWRQDTDESEITRATGTSLGTDTSDVFVIGASDATGSDPYSESIYIVRIDDQFHSTTEGREDWRVRRDTPTFLFGSTMATPIQLPAPSPQTSTIADHAYPAGPIWLHAAAQLERSRLRLLSPVISEIYETQDDLITWTVQEVAEAPKMIVTGRDYESWNMTFPVTGSRDATCLLSHLRHRPVSVEADHLIWRLFVTTTQAAVCDVYVICCSRPPWEADYGEFTQSSASLGTNANGWVVGGALGVAAPGRLNYFTIGWRWDAGSMGGSETVAIKAWQVFEVAHER